MQRGSTGHVLPQCQEARWQCAQAVRTDEDLLQGFRRQVGRSRLFLWTLARREQCLSGRFEPQALGKPVEPRLSQPLGGLERCACLSACSCWVIVVCNQR